MGLNLAASVVTERLPEPLLEILLLPTFLSHSEQEDNRSSSGEERRQSEGHL